MTVEARPEALALGGVPLDTVLERLRRLEPAARACYVYDLDQLEQRARRFTDAFAPLGPLVAFALKANALPALLASLARVGLAADAASLGELTLAAAAGFDEKRRVFNGNGKTPEELEWVARHGVHSVNADSVEELDALERVSVARGARIRVALRVNPGIDAAGHRYVATGIAEAKFGVSPADALAAWGARARWPHLHLDGIHVHVGSQLLDSAPLEEAVGVALALRDEAAHRGAPLRLVNLGGGFGVDYAGQGTDFPIEDYAARVSRRCAPLGLDWVLEPGRWLVAPVGVLVSEVLWVKPRDGRRFVVLAAGMNDLIRPALYGARHRIEAVRPRPGPELPATVVGPLCESADTFADGIVLPPLKPGDLVAIRDVGAYGASMASNYNGRGRLAELTVAGGRLTRARAGETAEALSRAAADPID